MTGSALTREVVTTELEAIEQLLRSLRESLVDEATSIPVLVGTLRLAGGRCYALVGAMDPVDSTDD